MGLRLKLTLIMGGLVSLLLIGLPFVFPLTGETSADGVTALGRFHILVLHFPIALLLIIPLLEILGSLPALQHVKQASTTILILAIVFSINACLLGFMLATGEGYSGELITDHMWEGISATVLMIIALVFKELHRTRLRNYFLRGYYILLGMSIVFLTVGSHNGASLVHGKEYLYAKLPASLHSFFTDSTEHENLVSEEASVYESLIQPIFESRCFLCHYENKQKGDFRLDDYALMLDGGESGMAGVVPGSLEESEVHYRITLDPTKKGFMPPEGNEPLTEQQVAVIAWWIETGASKTARIQDLSLSNAPPEISALSKARNP